MSTANLINKYQPYPDYKDSGVEWLGELPEAWQVKRLGQYLFERREKCSDKEYLPLSVTKNGIVPQLDTAAKSDAGDNRKLVRKDDFVINSRSDRKGSSGISNLDGSVSLISIVLELRSIEPQFVHHLLRSYPFQEEFYRFGKGIVADLWSTNYSEMKNINIPIPNIEEQRTIAAFLDYETARIDQLITKQQQLIELLKEKRQAVISHSVTKGLNPNAPMKDSGVEWLGQVPEHWVVTQLRHLLCHLEQGKSPECEARMAEGKEWGVLKTGCVNGGVYRATEHKALPVHIAPHKAYEVRAGDLLMSRASGSRDLIGAVAYIDKTPPRLLLSDKVFRLILVSGVHPQYLSLLMGSKSVRSQIELAINGAEGLANNITKESIKSFLVACPDYEEQLQIHKYLSEQLNQFDSLEAKLTEALVLLQERRTALISAAVTGKIDLRGWQPPKREVAA